MQALFEKISFGIVLLVSFLTPIFFVPSTVIPTDFGTSLLFAYGVILAVIIYLISVFLSGSVTLTRSVKWTLGLFAVIPVVYLLAGIANGFSRMAFLGYTLDQSTVGFIALAFAYLFLVATLFRNPTRVFYSFLAFLASSLLLSLFLAIRLIAGPEALSFGLFTTMTSTMVGSWNNIGIFFGVGVLLSLISFQMLHASKLMKILLSLALVLSLFFLALVNFSFVWVILGVTSLLFIFYGLFVSDKEVVERPTMVERLKKVSLYPVLVFCISVVFIFWGNTLTQSLYRVFNIQNVEVRPSLQVTYDIARETLRNHPLFGSGPNTFVTQWLSYRPDSITQTDFWNTDFAYGIGLLPTFVVTTGLVGLLSWLLFFGMYLYTAWKVLFVRIEDVFLKYIITSSFFISLYLWIMAWIYVPSSVILILTFFFTGLFFASVSLSGIYSTRVVVFGANPKTGFASSLVLVGTFLLVAVLGYGLFKNSASLLYFQKGSYALTVSNDIAESELLMKQAVATVPADTYYRALASIEVAKLNQIILQDPKKVGQAELEKQVSDTLSEAIRAGIGARDADPSNYLNWISLGQVYESAVPIKVEGAYQSAQAAYIEAARRNPKNPGMFLLMARLEADNGSLANAAAYAQQAIQVKQNYLDAYYMLAQIAIANKDLKGAIDTVTAATVINPTDPSLLFQLGYLKFSNSDFAGAITALEKSLTLSPQYANAIYYLGLSYEAVGQHTKAIAAFTTLKQTNPDNETVTSVLDALKAGKSIFQTQTPASTAPGKAKLPVKEKQ